MKILITGSDGFIGKNLNVFLSAQGHHIFEFNRKSSSTDLETAVRESSHIIHCAGTNRALNEKDFTVGNVDLTKKLVETIKTHGQSIEKVVFCSSTHVETKDSTYSTSKKQTEHVLNDLTALGIAVSVFRLPNVFGKWCKPNYNSFLTTMIYNVCNGLDTNVDKGSADLSMVYIDDICADFEKEILLARTKEFIYKKISTVHSLNLSETLELLKSFKGRRDVHELPDFKSDLDKKLYSTFLTYLPQEEFSKPIKMHGDPRGIFAELFRSNMGQVSFSTSKPGITRGLHYHHTKCEKFIVIKGNAEIAQQSLENGETYVKSVSGDQIEMVETIPGYTHKITNTGTEDLLLMIWANEVFDPERPDTYPMLF